MPYQACSSGEGLRVHFGFAQVHSYEGECKED